MARMRFTRFEPLPDGVYFFLVKDCNVRQNKDNGEEFYSWSLEVTTEGDYTGKVISFGTPINYGPKSGAYKFFRALGLAEIEESEAELDTDDFIGKEFVGKVIVKENKNGDATNKFETFLSLDEYEKSRTMTRATVPTAKPAGSAPATVRPAPAKPQARPSSGKTTVVRPAATAVVKEGQVEPIEAQGDNPDLENFPE